SRSVGVVQRALDLLSGYAEGGGAIAVDRNVYLGIRDLEIARDILDLLDVSHTCFQPFRCRVQQGNVGPLQGKLILALGSTSADLDCGWYLHVDVHARNARELRPQLVHDLIGAQPLAARLQAEEYSALITAPASSSAHRRHESGDVGVACDDRGDLLLVAHHVLERRSLSRLGRGYDLPGVLRRHESG